MDPLDTGVVRELLNEVIKSPYGQFDLLLGEGQPFDGDVARYEGAATSFVGVAAGGAIYLQLRHWSPSSIRMVLLDEEPTLHTGDWDEVVELSATTSGGAEWLLWAGEGGGTIATLPAGSYRIRFSVRGVERALQTQHREHPFIDEHLIEFWSESTERPHQVVHHRQS